MATINISSMTQYYKSDTNSKSGTVTKFADSPSAARSEAESAASSAANNASVSAGSPGNGGGSSSTADYIFGTKDRTSTSVGSPTSHFDSETASYRGVCSWSKSRTGTIRQLKLKFSLPSGITSSNIANATLDFTGASSSSTPTTYQVCGPKGATEQTDYQSYTDTTILDTSNGVSFSVKATSATSYSLDITAIFKKCLDNSQGWITLLNPTASASYSRTVTVSGTPTISYETNTSKCGAPTSLSFSSIVKPGGTLTIFWSGASAGNNNTITGYDVYYKIGSAPTTSSYDGTVSLSTTVPAVAVNFIISSSASRGSIFYAMVRTKGSAGSSYYSDWKSGSGGKVNSLPGAPSVSVDKSRIRSGISTTVNFTVAAGADSDTSQAKTLYYATSASGAKTVFESPLSVPLSAAATYYFWTYDGLEYSSSYTTSSIRVNTVPTIGSITMSPYNNVTYSPTVRNGYVKNINGSASNVTKDSAATLSYQWKLQIGNSTSATTYSTTQNISTATSFSNIDVTSYGVTFNRAYRLALTVTDDLGDSATAYSSTVYAIPSAPTVTTYNQKASSNKGGNTNNLHFDDGMRFVYSANNTGLTRVLEYSTSSNFSSYSTISLSGTSYSDVTLTSLTRGTTYYFRIKYTCNTKTSTVVASESGYMRAKDITPNNFSITPASSTVVKPYTHSVMTAGFGNQPISWATNEDVSTNYAEIYTASLEYGGRSQPVDISNGTNDSGTVGLTLDLNSITTAQWKILMGTANAPNATYTITLRVTAKNGFGASFSGTKTFSVNFIEGFSDIGTLTLSMQTGTNTYTAIPTSTYTSSNRYPLFATQTIRFTISGFKCYANQDAVIYIRTTSASGTIVKQIGVSSSDFSGPSGRLYTLATKTIDYTIPTITTQSSVDYYAVIVLSNGQSGSTHQDICQYRRFNLASVAPQITSVTESESTANSFTIKYKITNYGGNGASDQANYSNITGYLVANTSPNNAPTQFGSQFTIKGNNTTSEYSRSGSYDTSADIIYFGLKITFTLAFQSIGSAVPTGTATYTQTFPNLITYYRQVPNLIYGKNFFAMNSNNLLSGVTDQLIEFHLTSGRNKIYFQNADTYFYLNGEDLVINCGSWT